MPTWKEAYTYIENAVYKAEVVQKSRQLDMFELEKCADGGVRLWRGKRERWIKEYVFPTVHHSPYVVVWGAKTSEGVGVIKMLERSVNATSKSTKKPKYFVALINQIANMIPQMPKSKKFPDAALVMTLSVDKFYLQLCTLLADMNH